ncbi:P-loop containing nucleoside triphosphate hydrolase protein [Ochromonadaceae sp. CCMP2298]|nr:P-loop containing nucleoside triphosphate hydrolase protein [Ochromonadaceae sp. CCMP2298]
MQICLALFVLLCVLERLAGFRQGLRRTRQSLSTYVAQHQRFSPDLEKTGHEAKLLGGSEGLGKSFPTPAPVVVGIAGGSASGKTTLARAIINALGEEHVSFLGHDSYYKELSHLSMDERASNNFDHPDALDTSLMITHLMELKQGKTVQVPIYDFATHTRTAATESLTPRRIIILDGILIFAEPELLPLMDMKIFVDTDDDIRLIRRIQRDIKERNRSVDSVMEQYVNTVRPMHQLYVEPSKRGADIIVPAGQGIQTVALDMCVSRLREIINFYQ